MMTEQTPVLNELNNLLGKMMIVGEESCWDYGFLESVIERCKKGKTPTYGQQNVLKDIHIRWSDEAMKSRADFSQNWNEEKEQAFFIALQYYKQTGYYSSIVYKYISNDGKRNDCVPTEKHYTMLVENKYSSGVIRNMMAEKPFAVGSMVQFRDAYAVTSNVRNKKCIVLAYGGPDRVKSHAKNAIPIQVIIVGRAEPCWCEVRDLKKMKLSKN